MALRKTHIFFHPVAALPAWMHGGVGAAAQFGPLDMPVMGTQELSVQNTASLGLQNFTQVHWEIPLLEPSVNVLTRPVNKPTASRLTASHENRELELRFHDDIVPVTTASMQTAKTDKSPRAQKRKKPVDMFVWNQIADELARRRLTTSWLWRELKSSRQVINGWKNGEVSGRAVPVPQYERIAALFGWSIERLTTGQEPQPKAPEAPPVVPAPVVSQPANSSQYSPMALDLAGMFDSIQDDQQKRRMYALMVQMLVVSNPPSPAPSALGALQTPALHHVR